MAKDGHQIGKDGDQMAKDGHQTQKDGDHKAKDGDQTEKDGDQMAKDGHQTEKDGFYTCFQVYFMVFGGYEGIFRFYKVKRESGSSNSE